jgi:hypothetical protein
MQHVGYHDWQNFGHWYYGGKNGVIDGKKAEFVPFIHISMAGICCWFRTGSCHHFSVEVFNMASSQKFEASDDIAVHVIEEDSGWRIRASKSRRSFQNGEVEDSFSGVSGCAGWYCVDSAGVEAIRRLMTVTRFAQPCIHTDALSVLLSALYLYLLPRVLIRRRTRTSGAGSSLFCALTVE